MPPRRKRRYIPKKERRMPPEGFSCFWKLVKDISKTRGPIRFVIEGEDGSLTHIDVTDGMMRINGVEMYDAAVLSFISRKAEDFERLFMAAAKKYDTDNSLMGDIYIAKIADTSKVQGRPAELNFNDGKKTYRLVITRPGEDAEFELNGEKITESEGRTFIRSHYNQFITGYKSTMKGMISEPEETGKKSRKTPESLRSVKTEDGRIIVDIYGFLGKDDGRGVGGLPGSNMTGGLGEKFLKQKFKGYVDNGQEGG